MNQPVLSGRIAQRERSQEKIGERRLFAPEELRRRVQCPRCHKPMDTHPYHAGGNAVIDTCERCHLVWLDAGELAEIGRYPFHGGTRAERAGLTAPDPVPEREPDRGADSSAIHLFGFRIKPS